ncbi:MAG: hypothetical protein LQ340_004934 [Diploschistes diacapsis]|nr:MAG: hypothetical protein LQ340_004934 [Diploschistes diacapsis]
MGLTWRATPPSEEQAFAAMRAAIAINCLWNGGDMYGPPEHNSLTLARSGGRPNFGVDRSAAYMRECVERCLRQLDGACRIAMFECARRDRDTPLSETLGTLAEMVREGEIGGVALSEVGARTIREAAAITKIVAVELELSMFSRQVLTNGVAEACHELGNSDQCVRALDFSFGSCWWFRAAEETLANKVPENGYSPIGRGVFAKSIQNLSTISRNRAGGYPDNFEIKLGLSSARAGESGGTEGLYSGPTGVGVGKGPFQTPADAVDHSHTGRDNSGKGERKCGGDRAG